MKTLHYVTWVEDGAVVARCLDVDIASEGDTEEEAVANLREALELYFEGMQDQLPLTPRVGLHLGEIQIHA